MKALVTGGGGFLGGAIVRVLRARGDEVRSFSRNEYPELEALGVEQVTGDLADTAAVLGAAAGCDVVFHVAAKAGVWGPYREYFRANITGTQNVLMACHANGIRRLVYTSSPSVVFRGRDLEGVDESVPYLSHCEAHYPKTKAVAEQLVREANGKNLATVSLRPHLIWGPGDNHLVPRILERGRAGKLRRIGSRKNLVDSVYIDNAAEAHVLAADRLDVGSAIAGKAYFISQGEPLPVWDLINRILATGDIPPVTRTVPAGLAYAAGAWLELIHSLFDLKGEPRLTRFVARELATAHWFDISAARRDLDYVPRVTIDEGLKRLRASLQESGGMP